MRTLLWKRVPTPYVDDNRSKFRKRARWLWSTVRFTYWQANDPVKKGTKFFNREARIWFKPVKLMCEFLIR